MIIKGQAHIIQFILFFIIGFAVFILISGTFSDRLDLFSLDLNNENRKVINNYISAISVNSFVSCNGCDEIIILTHLRDTSKNSLNQLYFKNKKITTTTFPTKINSSSENHKLFRGNTVVGTVISDKPIILTYNNNNNLLKVSQ